MRKLTIRELQNVELDIMKSFVQFCEDNQLTYMLWGGTLLGAVRHKGFIPWDDDIDILMPRPDYDKLLNGENLDYHALKPNIEIWHWKNGKANLPFIKVINKNTMIVPNSKYIRDCLEVGKIWIDIFPLDGNPEDINECENLHRKVRRYRRILTLKMAKIGRGRTWYTRVLKPFAILALQALPTKFICGKIDNLAKRYKFDECEYVGGILWSCGVGERMKKEEYLGGQQLEFEGDLYNVPVNYSKYLSNAYGNYMQIPPAAARKRHVAEMYIED